ncbi:hypothetical protein CRG98_044423 [Punica granatum]|uniref:Uncharacterized protein n=1 Tax=Punica granatum TaxID=22663 RepID=A0A2I0HTV6_PUNGR|nr:hypothetical protein CRG98_044423 [Punica granatum]
MSLSHLRALALSPNRLEYPRMRLQPTTTGSSNLALLLSPIDSSFLVWDFDRLQRARVTFTPSHSVPTGSSSSDLHALALSPNKLEFPRLGLRWTTIGSSHFNALTLSPNRLEYPRVGLRPTTMYFSDLHALALNSNRLEFPSLGLRSTTIGSSHLHTFALSPNRLEFSRLELRSTTMGSNHCHALGISPNRLEYPHLGLQPITRGSSDVALLLRLHRLKRLASNDDTTYGLEYPCPLTPSLQARRTKLALDDDTAYGLKYPCLLTSSCSNYSSSDIDTIYRLEHPRPPHSVPAGSISSPRALIKSSPSRSVLTSSSSPASDVDLAYGLE